MPFPDCRLYLLFTPELCAGDPWKTLDMALDGGVDVVQWRVKTADRPGFARCRETCRQRRVPLFVNDDVMLAVRWQADGAHVGQDDMPVEAARKLLRDGWLGISTHDTAQIAAASAAGADYVGFGPCHKTATKGYDTGKSPAEIEGAIEAAQRLRLPLFAIGGITPANLRPLRLLGIDRIAVSSWILQSEAPREAAAELRSGL
ncbi:MAG TPA: thiamine phosphate synthase [Planctomycetota bacterium]|nr:thiamine phosphate synthase [Planctomycetota bacterium]